MTPVKGLPGQVVFWLVLAQIAVTLVNWAFLWVPEAPWAPGWWLAAAALVMPLALGLQMLSLLTIRRYWGDGLIPDWPAVWSLLRTWSALTAVLCLQGLVFSLPTIVPSFVAGFSDGFHQTQNAGAFRFPLLDVAQSLLYSLLGAFYLWTYPAAVFALESSPREVHRWARSLAARTWPLAAGFVVAQTILLAERTRRKGPWG